MKKKILFVIDSLHCAGAEKSLITLLSLLDYSMYFVDLQLFAYGGVLENEVPKDVNILKPLSYTEFTQVNLKQSFFNSLKSFHFGMLYSRIKYSICIRNKRLGNKQKARVFWQCVSNVIDTNPCIYDIAVSYAQGVPTFYVADKITANKKIAWVNVSYRLDDKEKKFQRKYYDKYDKIVAVSETTKETFLEAFPDYRNKMNVVYDIINPGLIVNMADKGTGFYDSFNGIRILTIGRLSHQKGYDIALGACKKLKEKGVDFRWYALGIGPLKEEIESYIKENNLSDHFILLGLKANPYPYIKHSDIYVQTSRFEGFGIAIAEARLLNIPVVATRFDAVYNQMINEKNGLVVDMNADAVYTGIMKLIEDTELRTRIIRYLQTEEKGNVNEIDKIYKLLS